MALVPETVSDTGIHKLVDDHEFPLSERAAEIAQRKSESVVARLAPQKPEGVPIYFADEIPVVWLLQKLAEAGLLTTRWLSDGNLHAVLTVAARRELHDTMQQDSERMRRKFLEQGVEP